jgi:phosphatidylinositol-3-phosphatase
VPAASTPALCGTVKPSLTPYAHIVVIMDENLSVPQWQATTDSPFTHKLAKQCRLETDAAGETHPSFPNYMAVSSGGFPTPACLGCSSSANNLFHQLDTDGRSWRDYNQGMPRNCAPNTSSAANYRDNHNPAFWFTDLGPASQGGDGSCALKDVPLDPNLANDVAHNNLKAFSWIAPDDCHNMHWRSPVCETITGGIKADRIKFGDQFIQKMVTSIAATPSYKAGGTLIVVTWDEANELSTQSHGNWGIDCSNPTVFGANTSTCRVVTILISARLPAAPAVKFYSHYSLTRAFEKNFGLPFLGGAAKVTAAPIY